MTLQPLLPITWPCLAIAAIATASDIFRRRIPNWLVLSGLIVALPAQWLAQGFGMGTLQWLLGTVIGMALLMPGYLLRQMGAGDVKLMGAMGAFLGFPGALQAVAATYIAGGVLALIVLGHRSIVARRGVTHADTDARNESRRSRSSGDPPIAVHAAMQPRAASLPYAAAIAAGTAFVLLVHA